MVDTEGVLNYFLYKTVLHSWQPQVSEQLQSLICIHLPLKTGVE